ncbi:GNAT family N-acetyltransferase [Pseudenhygromyxa sp. WMMC2535]|uniref:GNAT family N-acetyltransferase n=1 Tax=Pseudenhygromyxa sp. WMMC2535 TaxID=2712867 RepID=UPI0015533DC9|nr:GNAT family protein [Pseudenhygromyxa sp. WMMC2535]NVB39849.1 GNAT family N-acetyltransferase [Pseudenhygromyxa sp. WMMC2535]
MTSDPERQQVARRQQEQMLKLITKGFYNELINYGVPESDIVTIATHLLGHVSSPDPSVSTQTGFYSRVFDLESIADRWTEAREIAVGDEILLRPLDAGTLPELLSDIGEWLSDPKTAMGFVSPYPGDPRELAAHFAGERRSYFVIDFKGEPVGFIGAENLDTRTSRLEMRKLVGRRDLQGMGIGKRATFGFLYYAFRILEIEKVYIYSTDINVRNLNINNQFGFNLEGVLLQELPGEAGRIDVLRMGLMRETWNGIFC